MRIQHPPKTSSHLTLWLGLVGAVAVAIGAVYLMHAHAEKKKAGKISPIKPVPSEAVLRTELTKEEYNVMRENGTEPPFQNEYWDNTRPGIYVDRITGEPLFSTTDQFDSGTGWPSFTQPIVKEHIVLRRDTSFGMDRIEIRTRLSDSHLGHLFNDGPPPGGQRYSANSAAMRFIPLEKLQQEGYGEFLPLFQENR